MDLSGNLERFSGFADAYDRFRPSPPAVLGELLTRMAKAPHPSLVVDLGSGTGLSARYWADKADQVIGIEPNRDMRAVAERKTRAENVIYRDGLSHQTGLAGRCAQIVTCSQSLHWMDPQKTFEEAARLLVPGGVFAAYDQDWPPSTGSWEAEAAYDECIARIDNTEKEFQSPSPAHALDKSEHLRRMQGSGCFRYTKEVVVHHIERGNAERLEGLLLSQGGVMTLIKSGMSESQLGIDIFRQKVRQALGAEPQPWYWSCRIRIGIV